MKLEYAIFYSNDVSASLRFYENILGLTKEFGDEKFIAFKVGDKLLGVKLSTDDREKPGSQTVIVSVSDLDEWNESMKAKDVTFYKEISDDRWGRNFAILDPDKNKIEFTE